MSGVMLANRHLPDIVRGGTFLARKLAVYIRQSGGQSHSGTILSADAAGPDARFHDPIACIADQSPRTCRRRPLGRSRG